MAARTPTINPGDANVYKWPIGLSNISIAQPAKNHAGCRFDELPLAKSRSLFRSRVNIANAMQFHQSLYTVFMHMLIKRKGLAKISVCLQNETKQTEISGKKK